MWPSAACEQKKAPGKVHVEHRVPLLRGHLHHGLVRGDAGVVDKDVEAATEVDHLAEERAQSSAEPMLPWWIDGVTPRDANAAWKR
jgi:hypothetical protein